MRKAPDQTGSLPAEAHTLTVEQIRRALIKEKWDTWRWDTQARGKAPNQAAAVSSAIDLTARIRSAYFSSLLLAISARASLRSRRCVSGISAKLNPENRFATGFLGQKCIIFEPICKNWNAFHHIPTPFFSCSGPRSSSLAHTWAHSMCFSVSRIDPFFEKFQLNGASHDGPNIGCFSGQNVTGGQGNSEFDFI